MAKDSSLLLPNKDSRDADASAAQASSPLVNPVLTPQMRLPHNLAGCRVPAIWSPRSEISDVCVLRRPRRAKNDIECVKCDG